MATRVGRPRNGTASSSGDPRRDILSAAGRLFASEGVAATSMAVIAERAGLQPSSIYYYFKNKQAILQSLVDDANRVPLELVERVNASGGTAAVRLWRIIRLDAAALCAFPFDINEVHRLVVTGDDEADSDYWRDRQRLNDELEAIVAEGVATGEFRPVDARLAALTILANDEGAQNWFRPVDGRRLAGPEDRPGYEPMEIGEFLADLALRGLLARPARIAAIRRAALAVDDAD